MTDKNENMKLWDRVCTTDPAITKKVNQRGGFTAICAQAQLKRATELWGPYGLMWGIKGCKYDYLFEGANSIEVKLQAIFFYPNGEFEIATDMAFKKGNDSCKKLLTDLRSKSLSLLGFNSDIFENKGPLGFSDNKYVENGNVVAEPEPIKEEQVQAIFKLQAEKKIASDDFAKRVQRKYGVDNTDRLDCEQADELIGILKDIK